MGKAGEKDMGNAAERVFAASAEDFVGASASDTPVNNLTITITLADEAAAEMSELSRKTGVPVDTLLETSISLLHSAIMARSLGRRLVLTTRRWWPIKEFVLPRP